MCPYSVLLTLVYLPWSICCEPLGQIHSVSFTRSVSLGQVQCASFIQNALLLQSFSLVRNRYNIGCRPIINLESPAIGKDRLLK